MKGVNWYFEVNDYCNNVAFVYNIPMIKVAGILSALSPNNTFKSNYLSLEKFLKYKGNCKVLCFNTQKNKAIKILNAPKNITENEVMDILGKGLKTRAFFHNIYKPNKSNMVTVDRWQIRWAENNNLIPKNASLTNKRYKIISDNVKVKAKDLGIMPHQFQALTWVQIRGNKY